MICMDSPFIWLSWEGRSSWQRDGKNLLRKWERFAFHHMHMLSSYLLYLGWLSFCHNEQNSNAVNLEIWSTKKSFCITLKEVFLLFRLKIFWRQHWSRSQLIMWNFTGNLKSVSRFFFVLTASVSKFSNVLFWTFSVRFPWGKDPLWLSLELAAWAGAWTSKCRCSSKTT